MIQGIKQAVLRSLGTLEYFFYEISKRRRRYRVRLIGWYGFDSTGDDLMAFCIKQLFEQRSRQAGISIEWTDDVLCDLCIVGGGTIIGCDTSQICKKVNTVRAPLVIFGSGFRHTSEEDCRRWALPMRALIARAVAAGVRGPKTAEALKHYGMADDIEVIGDPAIWFEPLALPWRPKGKKVGICLREMRNYDKGLEERYLSEQMTLERFAQVVPAVLARLNAAPVFLSFCENDIDSDIQGALRLRERLPDAYREAPIIPYSDDVRLNPSIVGDLDYVISERMHPAIIAWVMGKPCVLLENQYGKCMDFATGIGMERYCLRTDEMTEETYMPLFKEIMENRKNIAAAARMQFEIQKELQGSLADRALSCLI
jgi:polysaccharide pyruvyl transferase WcaK-like protein